MKRSHNIVVAVRHRLVSVPDSNDYNGVPGAAAMSNFEIPAPSLDALRGQSEKVTNNINDAVLIPYWDPCFIAPRDRFVNNILFVFSLGVCQNGSHT